MAEMPNKRARVQGGQDDKELAFAPPPVTTLSIAGGGGKIPVRRIYCVGRNYYDHGLEMGGDPDREPPFFFLKPADAAVDTSRCGEVAFPSMSQNVHFECELVIVINTPDGRPIGNVRPQGAEKYIYGYAVGIDLTRRDLQKEAKNMRRCWSASKGFDQSAPVGAVTLTSSLAAEGLGDAQMELTVNGDSKQKSGLSKMIWKSNEIVGHLSKLWDLCPGDVIFTGTPAGVGPLVVGDRVHATVAGLQPCSFTVRAELSEPSTPFPPSSFLPSWRPLNVLGWSGFAGGQARGALQRGTSVRHRLARVRRAADRAEGACPDQKVLCRDQEHGRTVSSLDMYTPAILWQRLCFEPAYQDPKGVTILA